MTATTGLTDAEWLQLGLGFAVCCVLAVVVAAVSERARDRAESPLLPLGDWRDDVHVRIPGINNLPAKRRVKGSGPERLKAGDVSWIWTPDSTVSWQGQPIPPAPARLTLRQLPAPRPSGVPALPAFLWPNPGPAEPTRPVRTVYVAPVGDRRHVLVPAPLEAAS